VFEQQLSNASVQIELDVVVVDNSVNAQEAQLLQNTIAALQSQAVKPLSVQLILNPSNTGFGEANSLAFEQCQGEFVMLLNPDARMFPQCLLSLSTAMLSNLQLGACCPKQYWDEAQSWQLPPAWLPTGIGTWTLTKAHHDKRSAKRLSMAYRNLALTAWQSQQIVAQRALSGGAMMVRRSAITLPLFDPAYFMYFEDSDLSFRLKQNGLQLAMVPDANLIHDWAHSAGKVAMMEASKAKYFERHFNGRGQWQQRLTSLTAETKGALDNPLGATLIVLAADVWSVTVPEAWASGWLLEASPSSLLTPSVGQLGTGKIASVSQELLARMSFAPEGNQQLNAVYVRLGPVACTQEALQVFKIDLN
jgi:GT2 family glycosyltransferase